MTSSINMLVADDDRMICELFFEAAKESGLPLHVSTTDNGRDCLTLLHGGNIDLAFIDIHMPELSGTEAIWVARKQGINTFVTLMSGATPPNVLAAAQTVKAYEFLAKPFTIDDILAVLNTYAEVSSPIRLLIVDSSATVRTVVQRIAGQSMFNCEVTEVPDAAAAIQKSYEQSFDVVMLENNAPGTEGLATLRRLRALHPSLKVILTSAERDLAREKLARDTGASGFLYKPFSPEQIERMLHGIHRLRLPTIKAPAASVAETIRPGVTDPPVKIRA